jgi:hypothetical protein
VLEAVWADPTLYLDGARLADATARHAKARARLQSAEAEWVTAAELYEKAATSA